MYNLNTFVSNYRLYSWLQIHDKHIHMYTVVYVRYMCIHTHIHTHLHTYIHTHVHTHIHTHVHTYIHVLDYRLYSWLQIHDMCMHIHMHTYNTTGSTPGGKFAEKRHALALWVTYVHAHIYTHTIPQG
jgi:hypothetical protein